MTKTYKLNPGRAAALLYVHPPEADSTKAVSCVYLNAEFGVVVGRYDSYDKPLADSGWPIEVQDAIKKHFATVFGLEHENWYGKGPSPRARYCYAIQPWEVEVPEELL